MLTGIYAARNILGADHDLWDVNVERFYHEEMQIDRSPRHRCRRRVTAQADAAPLFGLRGAVLALALAVVLCWPIWVTGASFVYPDTGGYLFVGETIWQRLGAIWHGFGAPQTDIPAGPGSPDAIIWQRLGAIWHDAGGPQMDVSAGPGSADAAVDAGPGSLRSLTYAVAASAAWSLGGAHVLAIAQGWIVLFTAFAFVTPQALRRPWLLAAGAAWFAVLTPLPFHAVFLMPDLLTAVPILSAACLAWRWDALRPWQRVLLGVLTAFAASTHHGTMPLAVGCVGVALAIRLANRDGLGRGAAVAGLCIVAFGPAVNLVTSSVALDGPSIVPLRHPILLARSLEDGPAFWYLQEECPSGRYRTCDILDDPIPRHVGKFLWTTEGVGGRSPAERAIIRSEEPAILLGAFLRYPLAQARSLLGNAARQFVLVGTGTIHVAHAYDDAFDPVQGPSADRGRALLSAFDGPVAWGTWIATAVLAAAALRARPGRGAAGAVLVVLAGLAGNALIFGGLSAPVERYQSRVIWTLPFVLLAVTADALGRRATGRGSGLVRRADGAPLPDGS